MARALHLGGTSGRAADRDTHRQQEALDAGSGTKLTQRSPFIGTSGTKLAQHTIKRQFWALFRLQGEYSHARSSTKQSRAKIVTHKARKHERLERKIAPARGVKGRRETFFAHARSQQPFLTHFNRAGAMFLSLRMHPRHWSNPLGRYFFQDQTKTTDRTSDPDAPNQTPATRHHRCGGHRRDRRARAAVPVGGGARAHTCPPGDHRRACGTTGVWLRCRWAAAGPGRASRRHTKPDNSDPAPLVWRAPEGPEGLAAAPVGGGGAWPDNETTRSATHQHHKPHWCGGRRRDRRARAGFEARRRTK